MNVPLYEERLALLGERLRRLRKARGKSMRAADEVRVRYGVKLDASYLSRAERGRIALPLRTLFALADFYGVEASTLLAFPAAGQQDSATDVAARRQAEDHNAAERLLEVAAELLRQRHRSA